MLAADTVFEYFVGIVGVSTLQQIKEKWAELKGLVSSYSCTIFKVYIVEMSAAGHIKHVSIFGTDRTVKEMNEHPLALARWKC